MATTEITSEMHASALAQPNEGAGERGVIEGAREGAYLFDRDGKRYLDCCGSAGMFNLGRRHPELVAELKRAMRETDQGNFPMISQEKALLAQALADFVSGALECAIFSVTRGEAMDAACKIARGFTGRPELVTVDGGWYGQTGFALSLSQRTDRDAFGPLIPGVIAVPFNDSSAAKRAIGAKTAAVIVEPVQAENHCRAATPEYLSTLAGTCRAQGALLIVDETQTGFGRTGRRFAYEESGIAPDLLVLGEALGGGMFPIAATMLTQRVNAFMNAHPLLHLSTFGGADLGCRVAIKALEIYNREQPWSSAAKAGALLAQGLSELEGRGAIRGVAGKGLLLSLDLGSRESAVAFCGALARHGLLAEPGAVAEHTVVLRPSLLISDQEAAAILDAVKKAASEIG